MKLVLTLLQIFKDYGVIFKSVRLEGRLHVLRRSTSDDYARLLIHARPSVEYVSDAYLVRTTTLTSDFVILSNLYCTVLPHRWPS